MNLPEKIGWEQRPIGSLFQHRVHATTAEEHAPLSVTKEGVIDQLSDVAVSEFGAPKKLVRAGDLVINSRSDRKGSSGLALRDGSVSVINTVLKPRAIDPGFAMHLLRSRWFQEEFYRFGSGIVADLWSTRYQAMKTIRIPVPNTQTQRAIADYLDHETAEIDAFIESLSTLGELNRERRDAHLEQQVLANSDYIVQLRRLSPTKESGTSVNGAPWPAEPGTPGVLKTGAVSQREYRPWENKAVLDDHEVARLTAPVRSDRVLVNRANTPANVGAAAYIREETPGLYLSDKLWSVDFDAENEYMALALRTRLYQDQASQLAVGTSLSMQNLPYEAFLNIRVPVPPLSTQRAICQAAATAEASFQKSTQEITRAITLAKERRAALITAAVTGQIDVTATRRPAAEQLEDDIKELT
ncbi:MAG: hypothetical protein DI630_36590 [Gordonia sp. (in: high G+C Gram-positive bacteria)]|nr:MAG: hypothetical protein DI630_36590 [Gordonia sp. (in: high G+C Gram-positive bacteria)]